MAGTVSTTVPAAGKARFHGRTSTTILARQCGGMIPQHMNSGEAPQLERNLRSTESAA